jgi:hypothetical protein
MGYFTKIVKLCTAEKTVRDFALLGIVSFGLLSKRAK